MWHIKTKQNLFIEMKTDFLIFLGICTFTSNEVTQCPIRSRHSLKFFWMHYLYIKKKKKLGEDFFSPTVVERGKTVWSYKEKDLDINCSELSKDVGGWDDRGCNDWMASPTQKTCVWVNSGSWWWTGRPGLLQSMGSQRVRHNSATELKLSKDGLAYSGEWVPCHWGYSSWTTRMLSEVSGNWKSGWVSSSSKYFDSDNKGQLQLTPRVIIKVFWVFREGSEAMQVGWWFSILAAHDNHLSS